MSGRLIGVGVGPGDPGLLTLNAIAALEAADVVAHFAKAGNASNARAIAARHLKVEPDILRVAHRRHHAPLDLGQRQQPPLPTRLQRHRPVARLVGGRRLGDRRGGQPAQKE